jgi:murein DD-endopeptidase MepM/ murein hydrolase activator NlpD
VRALLVALLPSLALAAPSLSVSPRAPAPGDPVLVRARDCPGARGSLSGKPLPFVTTGDASEAVAALPVEQPAGPAEVIVECGGVTVSESIEIAPAHFERRALKVSGKFVSPSADELAQVAADREAFARAMAGPLEPRRFEGSMQKPASAIVSAHFGQERTFNGKLASQHYGMDIAAAEGSPVQAAAAGEVVLARPTFAAGNAVVVSHGEGLFTLYFHLSRFEVHEGQHVSAGEVLGAVGHTGRATGPHLHFAAKAEGLFVNPEALLRLSFDAPAGPRLEGEQAVRRGAQGA